MYVRKNLHNPIYLQTTCRTRGGVVTYTSGICAIYIREKNKIFKIYENYVFLKGLAVCELLGFHGFLVILMDSFLIYFCSTTVALDAKMLRQLW